MNKALATLFAGFMSVAIFPCHSASGSAAPSSDVVIITKEGVKSVNLEGGRLPKNSTDTYFLKTAVEVKKRPLSKPKAAPKSKAAPAKAAPKAKAAETAPAKAAAKPKAKAAKKTKE